MILQLSPTDLDLLRKKGISETQLLYQINQFKNGFPFIRLKQAATTQNGIVQYSDNELKALITFFEENQQHYSILKFVPASGAASRMFKDLFAFLEQHTESKPVFTLDEISNPNSVAYCLTHLKDFAFYPDLAQKMSDEGFDIEKLIQDEDYVTILKYLLTGSGLNYGALPKALLRFHRYQDGNRLAMEEHLIEAVHYSCDPKQTARVHFTNSPEHKTAFEDAIQTVLPKYEKQFGVKFDITFSEQKPSTDTVAVDHDNEPFRNADGSLLFRPGGHGALIENLNDLHEEIVFIKNIDNIVPDSLREPTYQYKKAIGGLLMKLQMMIFEMLDKLDDGNLTMEELDEMAALAQKSFMIEIPDAFYGFDEMEKIDFLFTKLNRPIRICGMVKNEGEPGGGPFWIENENGEVSLQIVESSQIDKNDTTQMKIVEQATHFNPVDLVCATYDFKGNKFDLRQFVDPQTGFISIKSKDGRELKALELPGLWNGAMADWITVFVETPIITFNPVKTINDLLRPQHQA
ncbi:MAG: DUF4301 family protein [Bacteroidales bacterium]|jgi:hypothetical protein|nr:DUF4301 family protein [Bacteroidales bacterium]